MSPPFGVGFVEKSELIHYGLWDYTGDDMLLGCIKGVLCHKKLSGLGSVSESLFLGEFFFSFFFLIFYFNL